MTTLPINEIFCSPQGEGHWTGTPSVFIRTQFCPVGCPWCDTRETWLLDPAHCVSVAEMLAKTESGSATWAHVSLDDLVAHVLGLAPAHVVITGGEPASYNLIALSRALLDAGRSVQIETSGTEAVQIDPRAWVTLSPKLDMPGGRALQTETLLRANEIKMPVGKPSDIDALRDLLRLDHRAAAPVYLQPLSMSPKATALCVEAATQYGWRVSVQTHKAAGWR